MKAVTPSRKGRYNKVARGGEKEALMKGKPTWKPLGLSANKWRLAGPQQRPVRLQVMTRPTSRPLEKSSRFRQAPLK